MDSFSDISICRLCKGSELVNVVDLGVQYIASRFPRAGYAKIPKIPPSLCMSKHFWLIQLRQSSLPHSYI